MVVILAGHKYATLALRINRPRPAFTDPLDLGNNMCVTQEMPLALPDHWREWLGTLRVDELRRSNIFLFAHDRSAAPTSLDHDNKRLTDVIHRLYFGLLIAVPYIGHDDGMMMTGAQHRDAIDVRQVQPYPDVLYPPGCHGDPLDDGLLREARQIADGLERIEGTNEHSRVWRIVRAFYGALQAHEFGARIHQFVRCVEGFVFPETGRTRNQMLSRTELFIGPGHHDLIGLLFDIRSAVEHLHGPYVVVNDPDPREVDLRLAELTYKSEAIARHCLRRLFTTPALWPSFRDDASLGVFWALTPAERSALWGARMDTGTEFGRFSRRTAAIQLFN